MSWEPAWVSDGRGGFRRNQNHDGSEDGEEDGEVTGEEEGEITASSDDPKPNDSSPPSQKQQQPQQQQPRNLSAGGPPPPSSTVRSGPGGGPPARSSSSGALDFRGSQSSSGSSGNPDGVFSGGGPGPGGGIIRRGSQSSLGSGRFVPSGGSGVGGSGARHRASLPGASSSQPPPFFHRDRDREGGIGGSFRDGGGSGASTSSGPSSSFHHRDAPPGISSSGSREDGPSFGISSSERPPFRREGGVGGPFRGGRDGSGPPQRDPPFPSGNLNTGSSNPRDPRGGEPPYDSVRGFNRDSFSRDGPPPSTSREPHFGGGSSRDGGAGAPRDHHRDIGREPFGRDRDIRTGRDHPFGGGRDLMRDRDIGPGRDRDMGPVRDREIGPIRDRDLGPLRDRDMGPGRDRDMVPGRDRDIGPGRDRDLGPGRERDLGPGRDRDMGPGRDRDMVGRDPYLGPREPPYSSSRRDNDAVPLGREPFRSGSNIRDRDPPFAGGDMPSGGRGDPPFHRDNSFGRINREEIRDREFGPSGRDRDLGPREPPHFKPRPGAFNQRGGPGAAREPGPHHHRQPSYERDAGFAGPESGNRDSFTSSPAPPFKKTIGRDGSFSAGSSSGPRDNPPFNEAASTGRDSFHPSRVPSGAALSAGGIDSAFTSSGTAAPAPASSRPTDPRRRPSKEASQLLPAAQQPDGSANANPPSSSSSLELRRQLSRGGLPTASNMATSTFADAPLSSSAQPTSPALPSPGPPTRRMSSYSSLADNASFSSTQQSQQHEASNVNSANSSRPSGFRSPTSRRPVVEPFREERDGEYYGTSGGAGGQARQFSPNDSRGGRSMFQRSPTSSAGPSPRAQNLPNVPSIQQPSSQTQVSAQQQTQGSSQQLPLAPPLRPPNFRNNDPRFKHQQQQRQLESQNDRDSAGQSQATAAPGPNQHISGLGARFEASENASRLLSVMGEGKARGPGDPRDDANKSSLVPRMSPSPSPSQRARGVLDVPSSLSAPSLSGGSKTDIPIFRKGRPAASASATDQAHAEGNIRASGSLSAHEATTAGPTSNSADVPPTSSGADPFGRTLDWKERGGNRTPSTTPRSSPVKQKQTKTFAPENLAASADGAQESGTTTKSPSSLRKTDQSDATPPVPSNLKSIPSGDATGRAPQLGTGPSLTSEVPRKPKKVVPLLTSELGDEKVVRRAETAVGHLNEVISDSNLKNSSADVSNLPSKQTIMKAMAMLDKKIKEAQKQAEEVAEEKKQSLEEEKAEMELEKQRLEEEERRKQQEVLHKKEERRRMEEKLREAGLKKALDNHAEELEKASIEAETAIKDQLEKARKEEKKRCLDDVKTQIELASEGFDKDISKVRRDIEKAKNAASKVDSKLLTIEDDYQSMVVDEEAKAEAVQKETSKRGPPDVASIISSITLENKRRATESHLFALSIASHDDDSTAIEVEEATEDLLELRTDPKYGKTSEEWSELTRQVTGLADALYTEPSEAPYYEHNERTHALLGPSVKEYIRDMNSRLLAHWTELAEEYDVRKHLYDKQQSKKGKKTKRGSVSVGGRKSILGVSDKPGLDRAGADRGTQFLESGGRTSNNPYRRARRGNEVRSESELEQIIAEIAAKEAMEKRITHGGSKLPRQICHMEREFTANYVNTFTAQKVDDPLAEEQKLAITNVWSDMEKCIFLDRFLQFPKDFRRIASFLRNKTTKDCVAFYYDSKQTVPYKGALKEHMMRRKRRGDYSVWDATIQSAISVGATVSAGTGEDKPVVFSLPQSDRTYATRLLHPLKRRVLDRMKIDESNVHPDDAESQVVEETKWRSRKRGRDPLFLLDKEQTKFLKSTTQEALSAPKQKVATAAVQAESDVSPTSGPSASPKPGSESGKPVDSDSAISTPSRKAPQKWTSAEKKIFLETLEKHGRDWNKLSSAVGTKTISQIKNFYYDYKKQAGKFRSGEKKSSKTEEHSKSRAMEQDQDASSDIASDPMVDEDEPVVVVQSTRQPVRTPHTERSPKGLVKSRTPEETIDMLDREQHDALSGPNRDIERRLAAVSSEMNSFLGPGRSTLSSTTSMPPSEYVRRGSYSGGNEFADPNRELIQRLISQRQQQEQEKEQHRRQQEQQQMQQDEELKRQTQLLQLQQLQQQREQQLQQLQQQRELEQQQFGRQQLQLGQQPQQSALQQLLSQHQREPNPADQLSVEEIRLLLQRQAPAHHQAPLSSLMPWLPQSQLLQAQRLQALQQQEGADMEGSHLHSFLQLQQQQQASSNPYGLSQSSQLRQMLLNAGLSPAAAAAAAAAGAFPSSALSQLDDMPPSGPSDSAADSLAALRAGLLNYGGTGGAGGANAGATPGLVGSSALAGNSLFRQTLAAQQAQADPRDGPYSTGVSDAMSLLARAMQQRGGGGDGGNPGQDGDRYS